MSASLRREASATAGLAGGQRFVDAAAAEWVKLRSVRSSWVTLLAAFVVMVGLSALLCEVYVRHAAELSLVDRARFDPAFLSVSGLFLAQVAIGVLGVLVISSEHATGMLRTSLAAVPRRLRLGAAKVVVFLGVSLTVGLVSALASFLLGQALFSGHRFVPLSGGPEAMATSLGAPGSLRVVLGAAAYLGAIGLVGLGFGALVRRTAGALACLFGVLLVLPLIVSALPSPWSGDIEQYLPSQAGSALVHVRDRAGLLSPGAGALVLAGYVVVVLGLGLVTLCRRDA